MTFLLAIIEKLVSAFTLPVRLENVRKVLVVDFVYLGDLLMSSPVHRGLKKNLPGAQVDFLGFPVANGVLSVNPFVDTIYSIQKDSKWKQLACALKLRKQNYDLVIHLNTSLWVNFLCCIIGRRYRLGYNYAHRGCFHNIRISIPVRTVRTKYRTDECLELLEQAFGWKIGEREMIYPVEKASIENIRKFLSSFSIQDDDLLIGLQTHSRQDWEIRLWEQKKFSELANVLIEKHNAKLVFTGSNDDSEYVNTIVSGIHKKDKLIFALGQPLHELAALLNLVDIFISINTGPMHFAVSQKTPTVAIIGHAPPKIYYPLNNPIFQYVMDKGLEDYDPRPTPPKYTPRIKEITVNEMLEKVEFLLDLRKKGLLRRR